MSLKRILSSIGIKSAEEKRLEAEQMMRRKERELRNSTRAIEKKEKEFMQMATKAKSQGLAQEYAILIKFLCRLDKIKKNANAVVMRFEMMRSMQGVSEMYASFIKACGKIGYDLTTSMNINSMNASVLDMEKGMAAMELTFRQLDDVFETIDGFVSDQVEEEADEEIQQEIEQRVSVMASGGGEANADKDEKINKEIQERLANISKSIG